MLNPDKNLPFQLIEDIISGQTVLFLGDGIYFPEAEQLLRARLCKRLLALIEDETILIDRSSFAKVAQYFELKTERSTLIRNLKDLFNESRIEPSHIQYQLARLPIRVIMTTNYDELTEKAYEIEKKNIIRIVRNEDIFYDDPEKTLFVKLHGTISQPDSLVLTENDLTDLWGRLSAISIVTQYYLATKTLIFLGFDLNDNIFYNIISQTTQVVNRHKRSSYFVQENISPYDAILWEKRGFKIINLQLDDFLLKLEKSIKDSKFKPTDNFSLINSLDKDIGVTQKHIRPYKFLDYYTEDDKDLFYGRESDIFLLCRKILSHNLVVIFGKSGTGKTSLIKAGIIPSLNKEGYIPIYIRVSDNPIRTIQQDVMKFIRPKKNRSNISVDLELDLSALFVKYGIGKRFVLMLDQFEELFLFSGDKIRFELAKTLNELLLTKEIDVRLLFSIREDYLAYLDEFKSVLPDIYGNLHRITKLGSNAELVITEPAKSFGISFTPEVVLAIIQDLWEDGVDPAQLQIVCDNLYENSIRQSHKKEDGARTIIGLEDYKKLGRSSKILAEYVDLVLGEFNKEEQDIAKKLLKELVTSVGTKVAHTAQHIQSGLYQYDSSRITDVLKTLIKNRLVRPLERDSQHLVELSHEYLIEKIKYWTSEDDVIIKNAREMLDREISNWKSLRLLMEPNKFEVFCRLKDLPFRFSEIDIDLLLRCSLRYGIETNHWFQKAKEIDFDIVNLLNAEYETENTNVKLNILELLTNIDEQIAIPILRQSLSDAIISVRNCAISVLCSYNTKSSLNTLAGNLPKDLILIPAGNYVLGSNTYPDEGPARKIFLDNYLIDKYPVTNQQYYQFIRTSGKTTIPSSWETGIFPEDKANHPVTGITWYQAMEYALWAKADLPTEAEWEKAARGDNSDWNYPWGKDFDATKCNTWEARQGGTTPVNKYEHGVSPYGVADMSGNTLEWTRDWFGVYQAAHTPPKTGTHKVVRGGAWYLDEVDARCTYRRRKLPTEIAALGQGCGFRCVLRINM